LQEIFFCDSFFSTILKTALALWSNSPMNLLYALLVLLFCNLPLCSSMDDSSDNDDAGITIEQLECKRKKYCVGTGAAVGCGLVSFGSLMVSTMIILSLASPWSDRERTPEVIIVPGVTFLFSFFGSICFPPLAFDFCEENKKLRKRMEKKIRESPA
jgi:hypothetical protein